MKNNINNFVVGGDFYKNYYLNKKNSFKNKNNLIWANTARTCFEIIISLIKDDINKLFIPNYLCLNIFIPILKKHKIKFVFYKIKKNLVFSIPSQKREFKNAILVVDYFGLTNSKIINSLNKKNFLVIYDMVQSPINFLNFFLLNKKSTYNNIDYVFTSFKKSFCIPNGSCIYSKKKIKNTKLILKKVNQIDLLWEKAVREKKNYILNRKKNYGLEKKYLRIFKKINEINNNIYGKITSKSQKILIKENFTKHSEDRVDKFKFLRAKIYKKFQILNKNFKLKSTPFFFPIVVKNRKFLLNKLNKYNLFFPTHWKIKETFYNLINYKPNLYDQEISLIIDNRISYQQLDLTCKIINKYAK